MIREDRPARKQQQQPLVQGLPLRGIVPPLVTPLGARQHLDVAGLSRLIEHVVGGGVHGVFVLGTTGEATALDDDVRREMIRRTVELVAGRVPVLVGVTDTCAAESLRLARFAADAGADAVVASTPYYIPLEQREIVSYVSTLAAQQPLPMFLYNIPQLSKTAYEVETVRQLAELPKIIGIKDSSGDPSYLAKLHATVQRPDWAFFVGTEALLADAVIAGTHGCVPGGANLDPALFVALYDAAVRRDTVGVAALHQRLVMLDRIYRLSPGAGSIVRGLKCALECLGVCGRRMAEPMRACDDNECRKIAGFVADLGLNPAVSSTPTARSRVQVRKTVRGTAPGVAAAAIAADASPAPRSASRGGVRSAR